MSRMTVNINKMKNMLDSISGLDGEAAKTVENYLLPIVENFCKQVKEQAHDKNYEHLDNPKNKILWSDFLNPKSKIAINCVTESGAKWFLKQLHERGEKWPSGRNLLEYTNFEYYASQTCYVKFCDGIGYCDCVFFETNNWTIYKFSEVEFIDEV